MHGRCRCRSSSEGEPDAAFEGPAGVEAAREHHARVREELPVRALALSRSDPAIPTVFVDARVIADDQLTRDS